MLCIILEFLLVATVVLEGEFRMLKLTWLTLSAEIAFS